MRRLPVPVVAGAVAAFLAVLPACTSGHDATVVGPGGGSAAAPGAGAGAPVFVPGPCPVDVPEGRAVDCGTMTVPMDRARPGLGEVELAVAVLRTSGPARPDPIVYLAGGPGSSALAELEDWAAHPYEFLEDRDLVLVDQRGTGWSQPSLACPEVSASEEPDEVLACLDDLRAEGIPLEAFGTAAAAADVADLRVALGYRSWNLLGVSYGTRLALAVLRDHPEGVRSAVLDSVYPPEADAYADGAAAAWQAIDGTLAACEADPACADRYPGVRALLPAVVLDLERDPADVDGEEVDGSVLLGAIWDALYDHTVIPLVPGSVALAAEGDLAGALDLLGGGRADGRGGSSRRSGDEEGAGIGLFYAIECTEEVPLGPPADPADPRVPADLRIALDEMTTSVPVTCARAGLAPAGAVERAPVRSGLPVLLASGSLDPVTPPSWAALAAASLPASVDVVFPGLGHAVVDGGPCPESVFRAFLDRPDAPVDTSCTASMTVPWDLDT